MEIHPLEIKYWKEKDILQMRIPPSRPSRWRINQYDFAVLMHEDRSGVIVGFEILDFGERFIPHLYDPDAIPAEVLEMRFEVPQAKLFDVSIREVLEWAYRHYCATHLPSSQLTLIKDVFHGTVPAKADG